MTEQGWTEKHRPGFLAEMAGQGRAAEEALAWLRAWRKGSALMIAGPPGAGKTLLAALAAKELGLAPSELNASDERTPEMMSAFMQTAMTRHLMGRGRVMLVDEADGISGRSDRGAAGAIAELIKTSSYPVIIIANDPYDQKLRPVRSLCTVLKMGKVPSPSIAKYLRGVCRKEGIEAEEGALKSLARWAQGDMRSALGDLQMTAMGRQRITEEDLASLGFRERAGNVFDIMPTLMRSGSVNASRNAIRGSDRDPDELLLWMGHNLAAEFSDPHELARAFELLSSADVMRRRTSKQQNWRFKAYMVDLMACISSSGRPEERAGWIKYQPPARMAMLGRSKSGRALLDSAAGRTGGRLHCSKRIVKRDYLPFLRLMAKDMKTGQGIAAFLGLDEAEGKVLLLPA